MQTLEQAVAELYLAVLNRLPDAQGLAFWVAQVQQGAITLPGIGINWVQSQAEVQQHYPSSLSSSHFVSQIYANVLGRSPEPTGLQYWTAQLEAGALSRDNFINAVIAGAKSGASGNSDAALLANRANIGVEYAQSGLDVSTWGKTVQALTTADAASVTLASSVIKLLTASSQHGAQTEATRLATQLEQWMAGSASTTPSSQQLGKLAEYVQSSQSWLAQHPETNLQSALNKLTDALSASSAPGGNLDTLSSLPDLLTPPVTEHITGPDTASNSGSGSPTGTGSSSGNGAPPNVTLQGVHLTENSGDLMFYGNGFDTLLAAGEDNNTDIQARLNWQKMHWNVNNDADTSNDVNITAADINWVHVLSPTVMKVWLKPAKLHAIVDADGFDFRQGDDQISIDAGFTENSQGQWSTTDQLSNTLIDADYAQLFYAQSATQVAPAARSQYLSIMNAGNTASNYTIDASHIESKKVFVGFLQTAGQTYTLENVTPAIQQVYIPSVIPKNIAPSLVINDSSVTRFETSAGNDVLKSHATDQVDFTSGEGNDFLAGGSNADVFNFLANQFNGQDTIDGGGGDDVFFFRAPSCTLTDADFQHVSNVEMIALIGTVDAMQSTVHHVSLGAYASQGLTASSISGSVIIGIMNGQVADNLVVDAAQFSKNLNINNAGTGAYAQESGHSTVTGGSGNDMLRFGAGTAKINFAASALANGQDSIYANPGNTSLTLDFSQFIQQPTATSLTDLSHTGLDLSGATNIGLACGKASISMADISLTDEVGKIKLADNGCAVVLSTSNTENSSTADTIWQIYYIADTDAVDVNWTVTLVGQLYSESTVSAIQNVHWS